MTDAPTQPPRESDRTPTIIPPVESILWADMHAEVPRLAKWWLEFLELEAEEMIEKSI